jgi:signal transduction histidine kinase/CheY-like chemotaxis protein/HPt (histidine-containing phosphotransfer) domain-containing protein
VPIERGGRPLGSVVLVSQSEGAIGQANAGLMATLFGAALAGLAGMAVAYRMQASISGPIVGLTRAMAEVRKTRSYHLGAELKSDDEVGDLIEGFNGMLGEIRQRDLQLANQLANLEREVSERTEDLLAAKNLAEAANASKSDFLATMSHEIRTPMNGIMVMAEMLASSDMGHRQRRYAEVIAKSGRSLLAIINDILDFSKIEAGKMDLEQIPLDISELVDDVTSLFWERARHKRVDLAAFIDPALPRTVLGDPVRLRQVIGNLVNNAIKFTETGGVLIRVEPAAGDHIRLSVQDTGIGIPADKIGGLFAAFTQVDQSTTRRFGGTGLGLAISKRLIDAMGGVVAVSSVEGRGSTFSFEIAAPAVEPARAWPALAGTDKAQGALLVGGLATRFALGRYLQLAGAGLTGERAAFAIGDADNLRTGGAPRPAICLADYGDPIVGELLKGKQIDALLATPVRRADVEAVLARLADGRSLADLQHDVSSGAAMSDVGTLARFEGRRILVADDSAVNREVAVEALTRLGAATAVVENGAEALQAVIADPGFDLVLMDGSMPEMDGFEATRAIRFEEKTRSRPRMPVIALTAHVVGGAAEAWRTADMDAVLHKPFTLAALSEAIARFVEPSGYAADKPPPAKPATPSPTPAAVGDEVLDPAVTRDLAAMAGDGRSDFVAKIHRLYRTNAPHSLLAVQSAVKDGDGPALAAAAHALKSMSYNVGAKRVAAHCSALETAAREGAPVTLDEVRLLALALEATLRALSATEEAQRTEEQQSDEALLLADLKVAIARGELSMVYQAQMDRAGVELVGCEALVRWTHPTRGAVSPAEFVPVAERAGVIGQLTEFVVRRVCAETAAYDGLRVSFNASALEFCRPDFAERLGALIAECGYDPARLEVEITETAVVDDAAAAKANIVRLRAMGIKVALDDFGAATPRCAFCACSPSTSSRSTVSSSRAANRIRKPPPSSTRWCPSVARWA